MRSLDWLTLRQLVACWRMHVADEGFGFSCFVVSTSLCIYPRMFIDRLRKSLCLSCCHREKDSEKAAMAFLAWKGLWSSFLSRFQIPRLTSPHRDMHVAIFIYSCVSFHIFKMLLTYDLYVWFSSCPCLHADWALDISCLPHDSHCAFFAACPYLCVRACMCVRHPRCATAVNQTMAMLPSTRIWVMNINFPSDSSSNLSLECPLQFKSIISHESVHNFT